MKTKQITSNIIDFLQQSNFIEGVTDGDSVNQAVYAWEYLIKQKQMTSSVILKTHKILMLHQRLRPDEKGYFRKHPIWIGQREGMDWQSIPNNISLWCAAVSSCVAYAKSKSLPDTKEQKIEVIEARIRNDHIGYERIHPFIDGNGRTGRMFMNWQRINCGLPILIIWEHERFEYYKWFTS